MNLNKLVERLFTFSKLRLALLAVAAIILLFALVPRITHITSVEGVVDTNLVTVRSSISGFITLPETIYPGATLERGNLIYVVQNDRYSDADSVAQSYALKSQLHDVIGECEVLKVELAQLTRDRDRIKRLISTHSAPANSLERIQSDYDRVQNLLRVKLRQRDDVLKDLEEILAQMELFKREDGRLSFDAVVWATLVKSDEFQASASPLLELIDRQDVWINAYFLEKYAPHLRPGREVSIEFLSTGKTTVGRILFVRAGVGRITIDHSVQGPPEDHKEKLVVARIDFDPKDSFEPQEFLGVGRSVRVSMKR